MAAVERQLVIAVEGTAALAPFWPTILPDYVEKIVRSFCGSELPGKNLTGAPPELALVVFHNHGPCSAFVVQRSGWTKDADAFLSWLSDVPFIDGGFSEAPTCEGLAESLMILHGSRTTIQNNPNHEVQKHCVLVAASNPYPLPTPVYSLPIQCIGHKRNIESLKGPPIADAETVAKSFAQCSVSLSVISPKQLPTLKAIYNAGKRNPQAADPPVDHAKNPQFLVLLSENFMEAQTALCHPLHRNVAPNQTILKMESAFPVTMPGPTSNDNPSVTGPMIDHKPDGVGGISTANVKLEPTTIPPMVSAPVVLISGVKLEQGGVGIKLEQGGVGIKIEQGGVGIKLEQGGVGVSDLGPTSINLAPAVMTTPRMLQQTGVNLSGVTNNFAINMPIWEHFDAQQPPTNIKFWEGTLFGTRRGQPVFICKLEGYRHETTFETVAVDWPESIQIVRLINMDHISNKKYDGKADILAFRSLNEHGFLRKIKEMNLCAVIRLPSQTLLLSVSDRADRLVGMVYPGDVLVFKPWVIQEPPMPPQQQQIEQPEQQFQQQHDMRMLP